MKQALTIGSLAKVAGVGIGTVRFYERRGLLPKPHRRQSGYREYLADDATRIRFIKRAQDLGFTLREIQDLLNLNNTGSKGTCSDMKARADRKLEEVEAKIADLHRMKKALKRLISACGESTKAAAECGVLSCFEAGWKC